MSSKGVVLMYHSVAERPTDAWGTSISPSRFSDQLAYLSQRYSILPLRTVHEALGNRGLPNQWIAITFDDGYANNLHHAEPVLRRHGIPATIFVVSGMVGSQSEFWWDEVERTCLSDAALPDTLTLNVGANVWRWTIASEGDVPEPADRNRTWRAWTNGPITGRQRLYRDIHALMLSLSETDRLFLLGQLRAWARVSSDARAEYRALTSDELRELACRRDIEIGSHTVTHTPLHALSLKAVRFELEYSRQSLETVIGKSVRALSYPFGSYMPETLPAVARAGYEYACGSLSHDDVCSMRPPTMRGVIDERRARPPHFEMPRVMVEDWTAADLGSRLAAWFNA